MKIINSYTKSLKLANHFILTIPSNPKLSTSLHSTVDPFLHQPQDLFIYLFIYLLIDIVLSRYNEK